MLRYAVSAAQESSEDEIRTIVVELLDEGEKLMQTIAEKWFEQGVGRGKAAGVYQVGVTQTELVEVGFGKTSA